MFLVLLEVFCLISQESYRSLFLKAPINTVRIPEPHI